MEIVSTIPSSYLILLQLRNTREADCLLLRFVRKRRRDEIGTLDWSGVAFCSTCVANEKLNWKFQFESRIGSEKRISHAHVNVPKIRRS
ncbi:hypothetical protein DICVIV_00261 [Dictyocaulus viviparus]|uniref:Uncharacterized protein n=1 Tax=Dictyocaulus viviparus TaxID=29172 RepID=A0A0D8Y9J5_DICVI|nr:hypothetical protein DICVIV_00261 [Dictyocaulus viviparus]